MKIFGNEYNRTEIAGAFGDLGTLVPFIVGYITIGGMDPVGILVSFGIFNIYAGCYFRTPMPIQPMKAIGGMAIAHAAGITHGAIWGAGIFTGVFWLLMGVSGAITWIERITATAVVQGIILGLGFSFIIEGLKLTSSGFLIAIGGACITIILLNSKRYPAMIALLLYGIIVMLISNHTAPAVLPHVSVHFRLPHVGIPVVSWKDLFAGILFLGLPQVPLTLGNAVLGTVAENNRYFPDRPVSAKIVSMNHGIMNLLSPFFGGVPVCHGAGGMAGHIRFGARTGGAVVMLGCVLLLMALFLGDSVAFMLSAFPRPVLGIILLFAGIELASTVRRAKIEKKSILVLLFTAGVSMWNMGIAYVAGLVLYYLLNLRQLKTKANGVRGSRV